MSSDEIRQQLKAYIVEELLHGDESIDDETSLISGGIVDSFSLVDLAMFIEERWDVKLDNTELNVDNIDTVVMTERLISAKLA